MYLGQYGTGDGYGYSPGSWWEDPLQQAAQAGADWLSEQLGQPTSAELQDVELAPPALPHVTPSSRAPQVGELLLVGGAALLALRGSGTL